MTEIEIKLPDLSRISLEPGDKLLLRCPGYVDMATAKAMKQALAEKLPGHDVIVLRGELELAAIRPATGAAVDDGFAFPAVPAELRPLLIAVSNIVMEELRTSGHRADRTEVVLQNRIRHAFEGRTAP